MARMKPVDPDDIEAMRWYSEFEWYVAEEGSYTGVSFGAEGRLYVYLGNGNWREHVRT